MAVEFHPLNPPDLGSPFPSSFSESVVAAVAVVAVAVGRATAAVSLAVAASAAQIFVAVEAAAVKTSAAVGAAVGAVVEPAGKRSGSF